jgi:hypothetical protein
MEIALSRTLAPHDRTIKGVFALLLLAALTAIAIVPPDHPAIPTCTFHALTGYSCLTCGLTRSVHAFVHGDLIVSLKYHIMGPVIVTGVLVLFFLFAAEVITRRRFQVPLRKGTGARIVVVLGIVWLLHCGTRFISELNQMVN